MSVDELAVLGGSKCILQLRGSRPFLSDKYDLTKHPNFSIHRMRMIRTGLILRNIRIGR